MPDRVLVNDGGVTFRSAKFRPEELTIREHHRFEGASDPDDSSIVYAIETDDGLKGTIVDAYGMYANSALEDFLDKVKMREDR